MIGYPLWSLGFLCGSAVKEFTCNLGNLASIPGLGRPPREGKGYPLQYSDLENSMDCRSMGSQRVGHDWATFTLSYMWTSRICKTFIFLSWYAVAASKLLQLCLTLWDPIDSSPPGSPVPGILQARSLEWVAISFSNAWKWKMKVKPLSPGQLLATPWTAGYQAPPSMAFSRQEYWSRLIYWSLRWQLIIF